MAGPSPATGDQRVSLSARRRANDNTSRAFALVDGVAGRAHDGSANQRSRTNLDRSNERDRTRNRGWDLFGRGRPGSADLLPYRRDRIPVRPDGDAAGRRAGARLRPQPVAVAFPSLKAASMR